MFSDAHTQDLGGKKVLTWWFTNSTAAEIFAGYQRGVYPDVRVYNRADSHIAPYRVVAYVGW